MLLAFTDMAQKAFNQITNTKNTPPLRNRTKNIALCVYIRPEILLGKKLTCGVLLLLLLYYPFSHRNEDKHIL